MTKPSKIDTPEQRQQLRVLKQRGYPMALKTAYHYKYREVNYFITTGRITIDPDISYKGRGFDALIALLEKRYPRQRKSQDFIIVPPEMPSD